VLGSKTSARPTKMGAPYPRFPVELGGFPDFHAPFLKERRTRRSWFIPLQEIRGISPVFGEMWDSTALTSNFPVFQECALMHTN
jgi:hypothetical protein